MSKSYKNAFKMIVISLSILMILNACSLFSFGLGDKVDIAAPEIAVTSHANGEYIGGIITISGTVTDDLGVSSVTLSDEGSLMTDAQVSSNQWSVQLDSTVFFDGDKEFILRARDTSNKVTELKLYLVLDNQPPSVLLTTPSDYGSGVEFNKTLVLKGEATDTVRVKEVRISMYQSATDAVVIDNALATGKSSWYYSIDTTPLADGPYYLFVQAEDWSGNHNSFFYHFKDLLALAADPGDIPSIEEIDSADNQGIPIAAGILSAPLSSIRATKSDGERIFAVINQNSDNPQFTFISPSGSPNPEDNIFSTTQRFSGFVEDDDGVNYSTVMIALWDNADNPLVDTPLLDWVKPDLSGSQWSYNANLPDGEYQILVRAQDIYGHPAAPLNSNPASFRVSSLAPIINITAPAQGSYIGPDTNLSIQVSVSNLGSGSKVEIDPDGDGVFDGSALTMIHQGSGVYSLAIDPSADMTLQEGPQYFKIRAGVDGNYGVVTLQYTGDIQDPAASLEYPLNGDSVNGAINIAGTSSDDNLIKEVYLWLEKVGDAATAPPADYSAWNRPDGTDLYNWIWAKDTYLLANTDYRVYAVTFDAAGNQSAVDSVTFTVDQESDRPVIGFSNISEGSPSNGLTRDAAIIGTVEDDDKVDSLTLEILVDIYSDGLFPGVDLTADGDTDDANESETWIPIVGDIADVRILNWNYDLLNLPQGEHSIKVRVHDIYSDGNADEAANYHYNETLNTVIVIDYGPPDLIIDQPPNGSTFNSSFILSGTASDPNDIQSIEISTDNGASWNLLSSDQTLVSGVPTDLSVSPSHPVNWSYEYSLTGDGSIDGDYQFQIRATDTSNAKTTLDRQLTIDETAPTVEITAVAENAVTNGQITFKGISSDVLSNGYTGAVSTAYYHIGLAADPEPVFGVYTDLSSSSSWNLPLDTTLHPDEDYTLRIISEDKAGNMSVPILRHFTIDQNSDRPIISFNDIDKNETDPSLNVLVGATTLGGLIEDDDGIDPSLFVNGGGALSGAAIEISIDNGAWEPVSNPPVSANRFVSWKHNISSLNEGVHVVKVRARDNQSDGTIGISSASAEYSNDFNWAIEDAADQSGIPFILNLGPPTIIVSTPANYSYHNSDVIISGTATDDNGISSVLINYNGSGYVPVDSFNNPGAWSATYTLSGNPLDDGPVSFTVQVTDGYGSSNIQNGQFTVDTTAPVNGFSVPGGITFDYTSDLAPNVNGDVLIKGDVFDDFSISGITIVGGIAEDIILSNTGSNTIWQVNLNNSTAYANSSYAYNSGDTGLNAWDGVEDGDESWTNIWRLPIKVTSTDSAGNAGIKTGYIDIDPLSDKPEISVLSLLAGGTFAQNLLPGSKQITGSITDDDGVDAASVQVKIFQEDGTTLISDWADVSSQPTSNLTSVNWSHSFTLSDGKYQAQLRAADIHAAGLYTGLYDSVETGLFRFAVDTANPTTSFNRSNGGYANGNITVGGTASDANGVQSVSISFDGGGSWDDNTNLTAINSQDSSWSYPIDIDTLGHSDDGNLSYSIKIIDNYGKEQVVDRYINIDTQIPTLTGMQIINNDPNPGIVNGSLLIQAVPADIGSLVTAIYTITLTEDPASFPAVNDPGISLDPQTVGWTKLTSTSSLNHRMNSTAMADGVYYTYFLAEDAAGNRNDPLADYVTYEVIQANDIPQITMETSPGEVLSNSGVISGMITDDDGVDVSTIYISINGGLAIPVSNPGGSDSKQVSFSHSLAGAPFVEALNAYSIVITASDIGEDFTDDSQDIPPRDISPASFDIYIDNSDPTLGITGISNGKTSSATPTGVFINRYFSITGTASDGVQVASVEAKITGDVDYGVVDVVDDNGDGDTATPFDTWTYTRDSLSLGTDSITLTVRVTDYHGNFTIYDYTLLVDHENPTIGFTSSSINPDTNYSDYGTLQGTYNQIITLSGEATDNSQIYKVYYLINQIDSSLTLDPQSDGWSEANGTYNWSVSYDTTSLIDDSTAYLHVSAVDKAGNVSATNHLSFTIHQDSDIPILTVTQPADSGLLQSNAVVLGSLRDDDGIKEIEIQIDGNDDGDFVDAEDWAYAPVSTPAVFSGKSINFEQDLNGFLDGSYRIQVRASDNNDNKTYSTAGSVEGSIIRFDIDRASPSLALSEILIADRYTSNPDTSDVSITSNFNGSYINNSFDLTFTVSDSSGIWYEDEDADTVYNYHVIYSLDSGSSWNYVPVDSVDAKGNGTYKVNLAAGGFSEGTNTIMYRVKDSWQNTSADILTLIIDTGEPVVSLDQVLDLGQDPPVLVDIPQNAVDDAPNVNGNVTLRGNISDASNIDSLTLIGGIDPVSNPVNLVNTGSNFSWVTQLANSTSSYNNAVYSVDKGSSIWRFPVELSATDAAGNITELTAYLDLDAESDKPGISVISHSDGDSESGNFLISGTITDDDGTGHVEMQIELNHGTTYTDQFDLDQDGLFTSDFEDESVPLSIPAASGSWSKTLTSSDFLFYYTYVDPDYIPNLLGDGYITILLTPFDKNGLPGDSTSFTLYLDNSSPLIYGLDADGITEVAEPTPATGTLQKGTIFIRARFQDDKEILYNDMKISLDGGATFGLISDIAGSSITDEGGYQYYVTIPIDTTSMVAGGNGLLNIQLSVTDKTNKQTTKQLSYSVDNTLPVIYWNRTDATDLNLLDLPFFGTPPNEIYSFKGKDTTAESDDAFKVLGAAIDSGTISGIQKVNVYFTDGTDFFNVRTGVTSPVSNSSVADSTGTLQSIPFTEDNNFVISIDNRIEQGTFDQTGGIGDFDDFNESLKTKSGYDEWYSFFDTTLFPDGPITVYAVAYDEAGNTSYTSASAQMANYPPRIYSFTINGEVNTAELIRKKSGGTVSLSVNVSDSDSNGAVNITGDSYGVKLINHYDFDDGTTTGIGAFIETLDVSLTQAANYSVDNTYYVELDTTASGLNLADNNWYEVEATVTDATGNIATRNWWLLVNNSDMIDPVISIDDFTQAHVGGSGHIDEADYGVDGTGTLDGDADISGIVTITGRASDNADVSNVIVTIDGTDYDKNTLPQVVLTNDDDGDPINGVSYVWSLSFDTSTISNVAAENLEVSAAAVDSNGNRNGVNDGISTEYAAATLTVDVVPYISGITGTGFDSGLLTYVRRSAQGRYPISIGSTITLTGYNLPGNSTNTFLLGDYTNAASVEDTDYVRIDSTGSSTAISVLLSRSNISTTLGDIISGDITVITNGAVSRNNLNDNSYPQNQEPGPYNASLKDNREALFWDVKSISGTSTVTEPYMAPNPDKDGFDWMYVLSGKELTLRNSLGSLITLTEGTALSGGAFQYTDSGSLNFLFNHNAQWSFAANTFAYTGSVQQGILASPYSFSYSGNRDESYNWNSGISYGRLGLGNVSFGYNAASNNDSYNPIPFSSDILYVTPVAPVPYGNLDLNRYKNLKIISKGSDSSFRNYVAYFDSGASESRSIVFYAYQVANSAANVSGSNTVYSNDSLAADAFLGGGFYSNLDKYSNKGTAANQNVSLSGTQSNNNNGLATPRGRQEVSMTDSDIDHKPDGLDSDNFDLAVYVKDATTHYGFIAYFDEVNQSLKITANEGLYTADPTGSLGSWTSPFPVESNAGTDVSMAVDGDGGIHLAYQDVSSGYLKYSYLTYNDVSNSFTKNETVFVDALFGAGANNSIVVRDFDLNTGDSIHDYRPIIMTYSSAFTGTKAPLRLSYPVNQQNQATMGSYTFGAGANSITGAFLGAWETIALPGNSNPRSEKNFLYLDSKGNPYLGYMGATLEEANIADILD